MKAMDGAMSYQITIPKYHCDLNKTLGMVYLLKEIEQIATVHGESFGGGHQDLLDMNMIFVMSKIGIKIHRIPTMNEQLQIITKPQDLKGVSFLRKSQIATLDGELLIDSQTAWVLIDPTSRRILRPSVYPYTFQIDEGEPDHINVLKTKLQTSDNIVHAYTKTIRYSDMDLNNHMNNTIYGNVIMDALPFDLVSSKSPKSIYLHYQKEALLGDQLKVGIANLGNENFYIEGRGSEGNHFSCNVSF